MECTRRFTWILMLSSLVILSELPVAVSWVTVAETATLGPYSGTFCTGSTLEITCPQGYYIDMTSAVFGRQEGSRDCLAEDDVMTQTCTQSVHTLARARCGDEIETCRIDPVSDEIFDYPCGDMIMNYLNISYNCQQSIYYMSACEGSTVSPVCNEGNVIMTQQVLWGRDNAQTCAHATANTTEVCADDAYVPQEVAALCDARDTCDLSVSSDNLGDPCPGTFKYLNVSYTCAVCSNQHNEDECTSWAGQGECIDTDGTKNSWMFAYCRRSCSNCDRTTSCSNEEGDTDCFNWALQHQCAINKGWMDEKCSLACNQCQHQAGTDDPSTSTTEQVTTPTEATTTMTEEPATTMRDDSDDVKQAFGCEKDDVLLECPSNKHIRVINAVFGRSDVSTTCPSTDADVMICQNDLTENFLVAHNLCSGRHSCYLYADLQPFSLPDDCSGTTTHAYLDVQYTCQDCSNVDYDDDCSYWRDQGDCDNNRYWMTSNCYKECSQCHIAESCVNVDPDLDCDYWASWGECAGREDWMLDNCARSCRSMCEDDTTTTLAPATDPPFVASACTSMPCRNGGVCDNTEDGSYVCNCDMTSYDGQHCQNIVCSKINIEDTCSDVAICGWKEFECIACVNLDSDMACAGWADDGQCQDNADWMLDNCFAACSECGQTAAQETTARTPATTLEVTTELITTPSTTSTTQETTTEATTTQTPSTTTTTEPPATTSTSFYCKKTQVGFDYVGTMSWTSRGATCIPWSVHGEYHDGAFADGSVAAASNYCRNPELDPNGPWCDTDDYDNTQWWYCDVPLCAETSTVQITTDPTTTTTTAPTTTTTTAPTTTTTAAPTTTIPTTIVPISTAPTVPTTVQTTLVLDLSTTAVPTPVTTVPVTTTTAAAVETTTTVMTTTAPPTTVTTEPVTTSICNPVCVHGTCVYGSCDCQSGYEGPSCEQFTCQEILDCGSHGTCVGANTCECEQGWSGMDCVFEVDADACSGLNNCNGHGICVAENKCWCYPYYGGLDCSQCSVAAITGQACVTCPTCLNGFCVQDSDDVVTYMGCYEDSLVDRDLSYTAWTGRSYATVRGCMEDCLMLRYKYAGLQNGDSCYCGNEYGKHGRSMSCGISCSGGSQGEICGGGITNNVYMTYSGSCECNGANWAGRFCDQCADGYYGEDCLSLTTPSGVVTTSPDRSTTLSTESNSTATNQSSSTSPTEAINTTASDVVTTESVSPTFLDPGVVGGSGTTKSATTTIPPTVAKDLDEYNYMNLDVLVQTPWKGAYNDLQHEDSQALLGKVKDVIETLYRSSLPAYNYITWKQIRNESPLRVLYYLGMTEDVDELSGVEAACLLSDQPGSYARTSTDVKITPSEQTAHICNQRDIYCGVGGNVARSERGEFYCICAEGRGGWRCANSTDNLWIVIVVIVVSISTVVIVVLCICCCLKGVCSKSSKGKKYNTAKTQKIKTQMVQADGTIIKKNSFSTRSSANYGENSYGAQPYTNGGYQYSNGSINGANGTLRSMNGTLRGMNGSVRGMNGTLNGGIQYSNGTLNGTKVPGSDTDRDRDAQSYTPRHM